MYHSKYKHKHAARRARLFPEKVEDIEPVKVVSDHVNRDWEGYGRQGQLASLSAQQQQYQGNAFGNSLGGLFGGATFLGGWR